MNGFLSRNLIYTGITRAKQKVRLYGSESVLKAALENPERERRTLLKEFYSQSLESKKNEENNEQEPDDIEWSCFLYTLKYITVYDKIIVRKRGV